MNNQDKHVAAKKDDDFKGEHIMDKNVEIGSEEDPGRYAEQKFVEKNTRRPSIAGTFKRPDVSKSGGENENKFEPLQGDRGL
ncbi:hypothetical protein TWF694_003458 [Orbilia ellipsospora]|uniref:Uncharacterized protein n=1 Tax=Orbilia ellipsospora TaxID=2528407 RepID=A0AAV9WY64_9PEZI